MRNNRAASTRVRVYGGGGFCSAASARRFRTARGKRAKAYQVQRDTVGDCDLWLPTAIDQLKVPLGRRWNPQWISLGFESSLALTGTLADRADILENMAAHFREEPTHANDEHNVTEAEAERLHTLLTDAFHDVTSWVSETRAAKQERKGCFESLRRGMRGLIGDLEDEFTADDARWSLLGLDAPADVDVPDMVENVDVEEAGKGRWLVDWDPAARALRYFVEILIVGTDKEFRRVATVKDEMAVLDSIPPNVTVKVRVTAVNDTGSSVASEVVEFPIPALGKVA